MSSRDRLLPLRLPARVILVIFICAGSLAVHFLAESLAPDSGPAAFDLVQHGGRAYVDLERGEEDFVLPSLTRLSVEHLPVPPVSLRTGAPSSFPISPLLPPPNS